MSWRTTTWGEVIRLHYGKALVGGSVDSGPVRVYGTNGPTGFTDAEPQGTGPSVVVGRKGAYRGIHYAPEPFFVIDTAFYVESLEGVDMRWVYYALKTVDLDAIATGSAIPSTRREDLYEVKVRLPPRREQQAIGQVLGALDDKIAANRKISDSSNALIAFQVAARLQIATPLSKAPIHFIFGEAFSGAQFSEPGQGRPLIRIRDLKSQQCQVWTTEQRPRETAVSPGDLLIGMDAEFRATRWSGPKGVLNQRVMMAKSDELGHPITQIALRETLARIERSKSGTTVIHLNKSDLDREFVMLPAAGDLKELRGIVDPLWARATLAEVESRTLTAVRDELLPQLMSGRITVKDAERRVEEEI